MTAENTTVHEGTVALPLRVSPPFILDADDYAVAILNTYDPDRGEAPAAELVRLANEHSSLSARVEELTRLNGELLDVLTDIGGICCVAHARETAIEAVTRVLERGN